MDKSDRLNGDSYEQIIDSVINYTKSIIDISDYEASMISDAIRILQSQVPSTKLQISSSIDKLISVKGNLNYIILKIKDIRRMNKIPHDNQYHKMFTLYTKQGRPSTEAKVAEIYYSSEDMRNWRDKLSDIDNLLSFLESYINLIDSTIRNMESRRYDL